MVYVWADGIYVKAELEREKAALLVVIGAFFGTGTRRFWRVTSQYFQLFALQRGADS